MTEDETIWEGEQWRVTRRGVETLDESYWIAKERVHENKGQSWEEHMAEKPWVNQLDFQRAMLFARRLFKLKT